MSWQKNHERFFRRFRVFFLSAAVECVDLAKQLPWFHETEDHLLASAGQVVNPDSPPSQKQNGITHITGQVDCLAAIECAAEAL
jgi:hypothetical protein